MALRNSACRFKNLRAPLMRSCAPTHNSRTQFQKSSRAVFGNISARRSLIQANCFRLLPPTFKSTYRALVIRIIGSFYFCCLWKNGTLKRSSVREEMPSNTKHLTEIHVEVPTQICLNRQSNKTTAEDDDVNSSIKRLWMSDTVIIL